MEPAKETEGSSFASQHDAQDATLASYGERVLPGVIEMTVACG